MFRNDENLKDTQQNSIKDKLSIPVLYKRTNFVFDSYPKLNKLITALYIVTDIIDKDEPIRFKLRTLGINILSDINSVSRIELGDQVHTIMSFLDIASAVHLISEMNFNILKKEFIELMYVLDTKKESNKINQINDTWLEKFLASNESIDKVEFSIKNTLNTLNTLENNKILIPSNQAVNNKYKSIENKSNISKQQRRDDIIQAIKINGGNATITDVKKQASGELLNYGEKTLQRELISMVKEGILIKTGEKRWSKYFLVSLAK